MNDVPRTLSRVGPLLLLAAVPLNACRSQPSDAGDAQAISASNPVPTTTGLSPSSALAGSAGLALTVNGTHFLTSSTVQFNGAPRTTAYVSDTELTASIQPSDIAAAGAYPVTVTNPGPPLSRTL